MAFLGAKTRRQTFAVGLLKNQIPYLTARHDLCLTREINRRESVFQGLPLKNENLSVPVNREVESQRQRRRESGTAPDLNPILGGVAFFAGVGAL